MAETKRATINVGQLIEILQKYDPETRIVVPGYEFDYDDLTHVGIIAIKLGEWREHDYWAGQHGLVEKKFFSPDEYAEAPDEMVVLLVGRHTGNN